MSKNIFANEETGSGLVYRHSSSVWSQLREEFSGYQNHAIFHFIDGLGGTDFDEPSLATLLSTPKEAEEAKHPEWRACLLKKLNFLRRICRKGFWYQPALLTVTIGISSCSIVLFRQQTEPAIFKPNGRFRLFRIVQQTKNLGDGLRFNSSGCLNLTRIEGRNRIQRSIRFKFTQI